MRKFAALSLALISFQPLLAAEPASGWRGNGTGLWPDAMPPLEWHRLPLGAMEGMHASAEPPKGKDAGETPLVAKGLMRDWLVIGPFAVENSARDFDRDLLGGEATVEPTAGQKVGEVAWKPLAGPFDDMMVFGTAEPPFLDLGKALGFKKNQVAYVHSYVYSPRGGPVRGVVDHGEGLKVWVKGKEVYRSTQRAFGLGYYTTISKYELSHAEPQSPRFTAELKTGWNRLLVKISSPSTDGFTDMKFILRLQDPPDVKYDTKNIQWITPLPGRSTSTPILVGDRLIVLAVPDEVLCLNKHDGRVLWSAFTNYYEVLTPEEKKANPSFEEKIDPLLAKLKAESDRARRRALRAEIQKTLAGIDARKFKIAATDHFEAHFGIVGFTMPTPVSDGKHLWVYNGMGVAACFDLDGQRQWITRIPADELAYGSSPALADGVLVIFQHGLYGLDAKTGKRLWQQKKIHNNVAAIQGATAGGKPMFVTQRGDLVRPSDGEILWRPKESLSPGDIGWSPGLILGHTLYQPSYGVGTVSIRDLNDLSAENEPRELKRISLPDEIHRGAGGKWIDRWTAGSPLVYDGFLYQADIYQTLYAVELATGKMYYRREMPLEGLMHYNAVPLAASPTLIGKHLYLCDNQGNTLVVQPGSSYRRVAQNKIATVLERPWPIPSQETLTYAPPLAEGGRIYLRGEANMYCVGER